MLYLSLLCLSLFFGGVFFGLSFVKVMLFVMGDVCGAIGKSSAGCWETRAELWESQVLSDGRWGRSFGKVLWPQNFPWTALVSWG